MTRRATFTRAELDRAIKAAQANGHIVRLRPDGCADILPADAVSEPPAERRNSCDTAFGLEP